MMPFLCSLTISQEHCDFLGHVNNARYFEIFEMARWKWLESKGFDRETVLRSGRGTVLLETHARFARELKLGEEISVSVKSCEIRGKIAKLYQEIIKTSGEISASAEFVLGFFDLKARKLILPDDDWVKALKA